MSLILNGRPEPRLVLLKEGNVVDDFTLTGFEGGDDAPQYLDFVPDFLRHELAEPLGVVKSKLRGFRLRAELYWPYVIGEELQKLRKLFDKRLYDEVRFYPWATDKPHYFERVTLDDDNIPLAYHFLLAQRNFTLKLISSRLVDYVPLEDADFLSWGNITLQFLDLNQSFDVYLKVVRLQATSHGWTASTQGFFLHDNIERVGGSIHIDGSNDKFDTDVGTLCNFVVDDDEAENFNHWEVNGQPSGTDTQLNLIILGDIEVIAIFN
jgi:hypothetical protein